MLPKLFGRITTFHFMANTVIFHAQIQPNFLSTVKKNCFKQKQMYFHYFRHLNKAVALIILLLRSF